MLEPFKYRGFITYSHLDEVFVRSLHRSLEGYRVPKPLIGQVTQIGEVPGRLGRLFRDRDELAAAPDLKAEIQAALRQSGALIAVCSPAAAKSYYVNEEIKTFKAIGRSNRVLASIIDGEPNDPANECFPEALKFEVSDDGQITSKPAEPIAADAREGKDGFENAKLKIIAALLGIDFEQLRQREAEAERARARRARLLAGSFAALAVLAVVGGIVAFVQRNIAQDREREAQDRLVQLHIERGTTDVRSDDLRNGWLWFAEALRLDHQRGAAEEKHRQRIAAIRDQLPQLRDIVNSEGELEEAVFAVDDSLVVVNRRLTDRIGSTVDAFADHGERKLWSRALPDCFLDRVGISADKTTVFAFGGSCGTTEPSPLGIYSTSDKDVVTLTVMDARTGETRIRQSFPWRGYESRVSPNGTFLLLQIGDDRAKLYRVVGDELRQQGAEIDAKEVAAIAFSRDENRLAVLQEDTLTFYQINSGLDVLRRFDLGHDRFLRKVVFGPDGASVLLHSTTEVVLLPVEGQGNRFLETAGGGRIEEAGFAGIGGKLYVSYEGDDDARFTEIWQGGDNPTRLAKIDHEEPLGKWEFEPRRARDTAGPNQAFVASMSRFNPRLRRAGFSPDGQYLYTVSRKRNMVRVWRVHDRAPLTPPLSHFDRSIWFAAFDNEGRHLVTSVGDGGFRLWDLGAVYPWKIFAAADGRKDRIAVSATGRLVAAKMPDRSVQVWQADADEDPIARIAPFEAETVLFDAQDRWLAVGGRDGIVELRDTTSWRRRARFKAANGPIAFLSADRTGTRLFMVTSEYQAPMQVALVSVTGEQHWSTEVPATGGRYSTLVSAAMDATAKRALTLVGFEKDASALHLWNLAAAAGQQKLIATIRPLEAPSAALFVDEDRSILTISGSEFALWDSRDGRQIGAAVPNLSAVRGKTLMHTADGGKVLLCDSRCTTAQVVDTKTGLPISAQLKHADYIHLAGFGAKGTIVYTGSRTTLNVWDAETGNMLMPPAEHEKSIDAVAVDPEGRYLTTAAGRWLSVFALRRDDMPVDTLVLLGQIASEHEIDRVGASVPQLEASYRKSWNELAGSNDWRRTGRPHGGDWELRNYRLAAVNDEPAAAKLRLERLLKRPDHAPTAHFLMGKLFEQQSQPASAIREYRAALAQGAAAAAASLRLANLLAHDAAATAEEIVPLYQQSAAIIGSPEAMFMAIAKTYAARTRDDPANVDKAAEAYRQAIAAGATRAESAWALALLYLRHARWLDAVPVLESLLQPDDYHRAAWYHLALAESQVLAGEQRNEFCARMRRELDAKFNDADSWIDTAWGCGMMGVAASSPEEAYRRLQSYSSSGASQNDLLMAYLLLLYRAGAYPEIVAKELPDGVGVEPTVIRALALAQLGEREKAQEMLARAQELIEQAGKDNPEFDWNITLQWSMFKREAEALGLTLPRSTRLDLPAR
jgi:WD40 repeat protein